MEKRQLRIALAGNPNSGKTTIFNNLTGTRQKVGNWPGVTVEKKQGRLLKRGKIRHNFGPCRMSKGFTLFLLALVIFVELVA